MALAEILGAAGNGGAVLTNCLWCLLVVAYFFLVKYGSVDHQRGHRKQQGGMQETQDGPQETRG